MSALIEFLKVLGPLLRGGKMSYGDALTRFRAQFARPAEGMEKTAILKEIEKAPSNVIKFPSGGIHNVPVNQQFTRPGSRQVFEVLDDDAYKALKQDTFRRLIANTDDDVKAFGKRIIENKQDVKFERLTKDQRKGILDLIDDRIKLGNREFMNKHSDLDVVIDPEDFASGGIARVGMKIGGWTKLEVLINILKNTIKGSKDPYVKKYFPNWIKELKKNPSLANNENVWRELTSHIGKDKAVKNQRLIVHSDDSVDFFTQSKFGPHNIEKTLEFQKKHNLSRDQANKILQMEPEDRVLEMKRLETIRNRTMQAEGGIAGELHLNRQGYAGGKRSLPKQMSLFAKPKIGDALKKLSDAELKRQMRAMARKWGVPMPKASGGLAQVLGV